MTHKSLSPLLLFPFLGAWDCRAPAGPGAPPESTWQTDLEICADAYPGSDLRQIAAAPHEDGDWLVWHLGAQDATHHRALLYLGDQQTSGGGVGAEPSPGCEAMDTLVRIWPDAAKSSPDSGLEWPGAEDHALIADGPGVYQIDFTSPLQGPVWVAVRMRSAGASGPHLCVAHCRRDVPISPSWAYWCRGDGSGCDDMAGGGGSPDNTPTALYWPLVAVE